MLRSLYDWTLARAAHPHAERWLALIAFIESSVFPIPPDVMLLPMTLARRERAFRYAGIATLGSVIGAVAGYLVGYLLWDVIGEPIIEFYGYQQQFLRFEESFATWGAWLVLIFGVTFFPFKVITIASGVAALDPLVFILSAILARGIRFYLVAALLWKFGAPIRDFVEKRLAMVTTVFLLLLIAGFLAIKLL